MNIIIYFLGFMGEGKGQWPGGGVARGVGKYSSRPEVFMGDRPTKHSGHTNIIDIYKSIKGAMRRWEYHSCLSESPHLVPREGLGGQTATPPS
jgi:hypothetical protein